MNMHESLDDLVTLSVNQQSYETIFEKIDSRGKNLGN